MAAPQIMATNAGGQSALLASGPLLPTEQQRQENPAIPFEQIATALGALRAVLGAEAFREFLHLARLGIIGPISVSGLALWGALFVYDPVRYAYEVGLRTVIPGPPPKPIRGLFTEGYENLFKDVVGAMQERRQRPSLVDLAIENARRPALLRAVDYLGERTEPARRDLADSLRDAIRMLPSGADQQARQGLGPAPATVPASQIVTDAAAEAQALALAKRQAVALDKARRALDVFAVAVATLQGSAGNDPQGATLPGSADP